MFSITASASAAGAKKYFGEGLARADYYIDGQEVAGRWGGKGAARLGLSGDVDQAGYFALCDNRHPTTGERITPRDKDNRRVGYDFTFSVPKSVSVLYELSGDERILSAFRDSVRETMTEIESEMKTRVRGKGANVDRVTGEMTWAEFVHFTSRPVDGVPDPHLHAHVYAFNVTFDPVEKRFKAGQFGDLKRDATYYEAAFDARMARRLTAQGIPIEKDSKYSYEIAGVPESLIDKFSRRRNLVESIAAERGITNDAAKHAITRRGREKKALGRSRSSLRQEWDERLSPDERAALLDAMDGRGAPSPSIAPDDAMRHAIEHVFERHSTFSLKRLEGEALRHGVGSVLPEDITAVAARAGVICAEKDGQTIATTRDVLSGELAMLAFARDGRGHYAELGDSKALPDGLSVEQGAAAAHVLQSRDRVVGIRGGAGTGKTHMMKATIDAIERPGLDGARRQVFVFAPSSQASRGVLREEGFANAETLEVLLRNDKLQQQARGQVLWVDEAGLVSGRDMQRLFEVAKRNGNRIVLSGDYRQHGSVAAGDAFRLLESEAGVRYAQLKKVRRQRPDDYRRAVEAMSDGTRAGALAGFDRLDAMGAIVEAPADERHRFLVSEYLETSDAGRSALVIAPTRLEGERLTGELRDALRARGKLGEQERPFIACAATGWTAAQKRDAHNYSPGMRIEFHQNAKGGFRRGERAVVAGVVAGRVELVREDGSNAVLPESPERLEVYRPRELRVAVGERLRITKNGHIADRRGKQKRVSNGDIVTVDGFTREGDVRLQGGLVLPRNFGHLAFGYVDTSYASQGKTVDRVFIAAGDSSLPAMNSQQWYVSASRGRDAVRIYVDDRQDVRDAIARSATRLSAVELLKPPPSSRRAQLRLQERLERNRVLRYLRDRAGRVVDGWRQRVARERALGEVQHA